MRSSVLLAQLALFASTSHAFYPYAPDWLQEEWVAENSIAATGIKLDIKQRATKDSSTSPEAVSRHAAQLAAKYGVAVEKRANAYQIMRAEDTKGEFTEGLHQDGGDYSYFAEVELGSKRAKFLMLVDTGSASSWIMGSGCTTEACSLHDTFGPEDSDTFEEVDETFSITYGTGVVNGSLARDHFRFSGLDVTYKIGVAGWTSKDFVKFPFDGVMGLAGGKSSSDLMLDVIGQKLDKKVFGVALHRSADGPNTGELSLGSINSARHSGKISYNSLSEGEEWAIELKDVSVDGKGAGAGGVRSFIDTGTSFIFAAPQRVKKIHSMIPGAETSDGSTWRVPCDSKSKIAFSFAGGSYDISPKDWISPQNSNGKCTSNIYGIEIVPGAWLLGDAFIKNVYTVFDWDQKQIGFAPIVAPEASKPSTTSLQPPRSTTSSGSQPTKAPTTTASESAPGPGSSLGLVGGPTQQTPVPERPGSPADSDSPEGKDDDSDGKDEGPEGLASGLVSRNAAVYSTLLCIGTLFALLF